MIVTFCGHTQFCKSKELERSLLAFLEEKVGETPTDMYLGGYGEFDAFAYECCKKYKQTHNNVSIVYITPYITEGFAKNYLQAQKTRYDFILYPEIENKPLRFAIVYRNQYMVDKADLVVAYVSHRWGGAYKTYRYAQRKGKKILNLADFDDELI